MNLISPGASVCLAPGIRVVVDHLEDADERAYPLNAAGLKICELLGEYIEFGALVTALGWVLGPAAPKSLPQITSDFLRDMNDRGLVSIVEPLFAEIVASLWSVPKTMMVTLVTRKRPSLQMTTRRRYDPTPTNIVRGCLEADQATMWVGIVVVGFFAAILAAAAAVDPATWNYLLPLVLVLSAFFLLILGSLVFHELGHYFAARATGSKIPAVIVRLGAMGVAFRQPRPGYAALVAAAGPLVSALFSLVAVGLVLDFPGSNWAVIRHDYALLTIAAVAVVIGATQLCYLLPFTSDGKEIRVSILSAVQGRRFRRRFS